MESSSKIRMIVTFGAISLLTITDVCGTDVSTSSPETSGVTFGVEGLAEARNSGDVMLDITSSAIPNMIETNSRGELVFTNPGAMCTIRTTDTRRLNLKVKLEGVSPGSMNLSNRHYILIRRNGDDVRSIWSFILGTWLFASYQDLSLDISNGDWIELFPRISRASLGFSPPKEVTPGTLVSNAGLGVTADTEVDFGCIYRVKISITPSSSS